MAHCYHWDMKRRDFLVQAGCGIAVGSPIFAAGAEGGLEAAAAVFETGCEDAAASAAVDAAGEEVNRRVGAAVTEILAHARREARARLGR